MYYNLVTNSSRETGFRDRDRDNTSSYRERDRFGSGDRFHSNNNSPRATFGASSSPRSAENAVDNSASAALSAAMGINLSKTAEKKKGLGLIIRSHHCSSHYSSAARQLFGLHGKSS